MSKSYHEIMEKIEVTDEMRSRILNNISDQALGSPKKVLRFSKWKKAASLAACISLLIICGTIIQNSFHSNSEKQGDGLANPVAEIVECKSAEELSQKAGFTVQDIKDIPFEVESTSYTWCWDEFAQVEYIGNDNTLIYRKTVGDEDISGDYTDYEKIFNEKINGVDIIIKGNKDLYYLATWQSEGYSSSISVLQGIDYHSMLKTVESIGLPSF